MKKSNKLLIYPLLVGFFCIVCGAFLNKIYSVRGEILLRQNESSNIVTNPKEYQLTIQTKDKTKTLAVSSLKRDLHFLGLPQYRVDDVIEEAYLDYRIFNKKDAAINPAINLNIDGQNIWLLNDQSYPEFKTEIIINGLMFILGDAPVNANPSIPTYLIQNQNDSWTISNTADPENSKITLHEKESFAIKELKSKILVKHLISHAKVNRVAIPKDGGSPAIALHDNRTNSTTWISKEYPFESKEQKNEVAYLHNKDFLLPFRINLKELKLDQDNLPEAALEITDNYKKHNYNVYLNNPLEYLGYTIVLSAFNKHTQDSVLLLISKDPYINLIYCGAVIILLAIMVMFCNGIAKD